MKFSVATNFQNDFIDKINKKDIYEIYGKLTTDFIGGGRPSFALPSISKRRLFDHVREVHEKGLKFNYLLNSTCLGNKEFTYRGKRKINQILDWLEKIEVDTVTVAIPYLLELIKKRDLNFKVKISVDARITNLGIAKHWENLGADVLILDSKNLNRDFKNLRIIRKNIRCELELIANSCCLYSCPFNQYHSAINSHASSFDNEREDLVIDYCNLSCKYIRLKELVNFIRACWIRPEDIHYYEELGIDSLKILDRSITTESIALRVDAYTKRRYNGNLADLVNQRSSPFIKVRKRLLLGLRLLFGYCSFNFGLLKKFSDVTVPLNFYIDNRALDGFLEYFIEGKCKQQGACGECGYCYEVAKRTIQIDEKYRQQMLEKYREVFELIYK